MNINEIIEYLKAYDGPDIKMMEVCGTHTASIFKSGIRSLISPRIHLISGPGCPVCVTPTAYIDKCGEYALMDNHVLMTFGDMIKVPGTHGSLADLKGEGAHVEMMYSPFEAIEKATSTKLTIKQTLVNPVKVLLIDPGIITRHTADIIAKIVNIFTFFIFYLFRIRRFHQS